MVSVGSRHLWKKNDTWVRKIFSSNTIEALQNTDVYAGF
jgi:hypothetical protein